ncbi:PREDICTED: uncharacterized protein LOC104612456 [Nelumbo nucifera]|uniref:Uncharacterized protein n=2 Tax=Nelumbo nucifera TaxID=4432 RepID=A0A822YM83_NELNU|nr:PREDICTED: uncharacterized protein LOC104612456 [Nelumbo nucifera]DAD33597.1 TPA_asm: hypothetical protein HUJ06_012448 [Nelumbo nucifera]
MQIHGVLFHLKNAPTALSFIQPTRASPSICKSVDLSDRYPSIVAARRNRRRTASRWQRSSRVALQCVSLIASNLKMIPEPLDFIIREGFGGGNGGGLGFLKGLGGGGFDGWGRRRSRWHSRFGLLGLLGACALVLLLVLAKELDTCFGLGVVNFVLLGFLIRDWKAEIKGWVLGFCSCALMVLCGLRREELQKCVKNFRVHSPIMGMIKSKRRRRAV